MKQTVLHQKELQLSAKMTDFQGWQVPLQYSTVLDEYHAVRTAAGLFDVSFLGRIAGSVERIAGVKPGAGAEDVPDLGRPDEAGHAGGETAPRKPPRIVAGKKELDHA